MTSTPPHYTARTILRGTLSDAEVLEIFSRLNRYSVRLNNQELLNGTYFGHFKQSCYALSYEHLEFWRRNGVFTENGIARMLEVQLVSELTISQLDGLQDKKSSIPDFYDHYDNVYEERDRVEAQFRSTIDQIAAALEGELRVSEFHRAPLFYSLFNTVFHRFAGLPQTELATPRRRLNRDELVDLRDAVAKLSDVISAGRREETVPKKYQRFVNSCLRQTDNLQPRSIRFEVLYREAFE